ncbi:hypothetical protein LRS73_19335 [Methylobacterium currus]|uniref:hypothetical protein n=1 Tax=Methylobacterium currus TaxID=2051553 RepID=UPI001E31BAD3|nr:hypothetical protein [Methylobacterium currus]UHC14682.1 hypothetical protein LRS73_19335 [Methylobacterium currus]
MTQWRPDLTLARLTGALEAEILAAPEPEVRALVTEAAGETEALRMLVLRAVDRAEEGAGLPPGLAGGAAALRRP